MELLHSSGGGDREAYVAWERGVCVDCDSAIGLYVAWTHKKAGHVRNKFWSHTEILFLLGYFVFVVDI